MTRFASAILGSALLMASVASADAGWQRNGTTTGPRGGQSTFHGSGSCSGGTCSSNQRRTGPAGNSVTRSGTTTCANGSCNGSATYAGPGGNTVTRSRSSTRN